VIKDRAMVQSTTQRIQGHRVVVEEEKTGKRGARGGSRKGVKEERKTPDLSRGWL